MREFKRYFSMWPYVEKMLVAERLGDIFTGEPQRSLKDHLVQQLLDELPGEYREMWVNGEESWSSVHCDGRDFVVKVGIPGIVQP